MSAQGNVIPQPQKAMPEWLTRRDMPTEAWTVQQGNAQRGDAWTNITACEMRVPFGDDEVSRLVRAHEMTHAKVSPKMVDPRVAAHYGVTDDMLRACEEFRVNMLVGKAGFDVNELRDGSEGRTGEIAGTNNDWNNALTMMIACAGTKSATDFLRGVKKANPDMEASLRKIHNALKARWRKQTRHSHKVAADTREHRLSVGEEESTTIPVGYRKFTVEYAKWLSQFLVNTDELADDGDIEFPDAEEVGKQVRSAGSGTFARLVELSVPKPRSVDGRMGRKRVATNIGRNPRRIERMLTDPEQRIFDRRTRGKGGVVLIDQSGSMSLTENDVWKIVEAAPGCVIIGYSHRAGTTDEPNIWVMADRGRVCADVPMGRGGNGVDGPAIRFAQKRRRAGEPFVWVCDGLVTDGTHDRPSDALSEECANLVVKYGIHMTKDVEQGVSALRRASAGRLPAEAVGSIRHTRAWSDHVTDSRS
jgi:hypothetical protein